LAAYDECVTIKKCDKCRKVIKGEPVLAGVGFWKRVELCQACGEPVLKFLRASNLLGDELEKLVTPSSKHRSLTPNNR